MVTKTLTVSDAPSDAEGNAKIVRVIRNMNFLKFREKGHVVPVRTEAHPSPVKQSASNRQPGQSHTRTTLGAALDHELAMARYLMDDLADHVFGHIVSTNLAKDILRKFVDDGFVKVFKGPSQHLEVHPNSEAVRHAIEQAFDDADIHDCIRPGTESDGGEPESSTDVKGKQASSKARGKKKQETYTFKWDSFPGEPINEDELVEFLNKVTDRAFDFAQPKLAKVVPRLKHRFVTRTDKNHAMPLSYEPDGEDMRPDFLLLPAQAFSDDFKTVDPRYLNFTASRLVGESKNKELAAGVTQVQRYARGLKRAQPWVHYVLAMVITKDKAVFMRGEGSGTERLELLLSEGRGCIEFIRILLGLALAEDVELGQNPDVELTSSTRTSGTNSASHNPVISNVPRTTNTKSAAASSSDAAIPKAASDALPISSRTRSASVASKRGASASVVSRTLVNSSRNRKATRPCHQPTTSASSVSSKRVHSELELGDDDNKERQRKKSKVAEAVATQEERVIFFPLRVYGHMCLGILFTSSSIRGRGTTVFCVVDLSDEKTRLALKMSWQDLERVVDQDTVMERLKNKSHPNVIVPVKSFNADRDGEICTTLGAIRGFLDEQIDLLQVENRVLTITISELKRPVQYFWGVHDFVRGLRGALLGHQFITSIGILHRDISENNIVLGLYPWEERGYLIDFDMAILQDTEEPTLVSLDSRSSVKIDTEISEAPESSSVSLSEQDEKQHIKALRTGTFPYISFSVLRGKAHTHFDDVESFFYVLLLFFFSYSGPLSKTELEDAHDKGFARPIGAGRLSHIRNWPKKFVDWADGEPDSIAHSKSFYTTHPVGAKELLGITEIVHCLENNWPEDLRRPIRAMLWSTLKMFEASTKGMKTPEGRTEVSHDEFVAILDKWLVKYAELEEKYSNCPDFRDLRNQK